MLKKITSTFGNQIGVVSPIIARPSIIVQSQRWINGKQSEDPELIRTQERGQRDESMEHVQIVQSSQGTQPFSPNENPRILITGKHKWTMSRTFVTTSTFLFEVS